MTLELITETGSYTGNGSSQTITIGWQPALVLIASHRTGGPGGGRGFTMKVAAMSGDDVQGNSTEAEYKTTNGVTLTSTGFSVGSDQEYNHSGETFSYIAFRDSPALDYGTYTGNTGTQTITTGRQPTMLFVCQTSGTELTFWKYNSLSGADAVEFQTEISLVSALTLQTTGFQASGNANLNSETYVYVSINVERSSTVYLECGSYTGNTADAQTITLGYQPKFVLIFDDGNGPGGSPQTAIKVDTMSGVLAGFIERAYNYAGGATNIAAINSTGFVAWDSWNGNGAVYSFCAGHY